MFGQVGDITEVFLPIDRATGQPRGFAFVEFSDSSVVAEAISKFDGTEFQGRRLKVNEATERAPRPQGANFGPDDRRERSNLRCLRRRSHGLAQRPDYRVFAATGGGRVMQPVE